MNYLQMIARMRVGWELIATRNAVGAPFSYVMTRSDDPRTYRLDEGVVAKAVQQRRLTAQLSVDQLSITYRAVKP